ncbi:MAG: hypothetical protein ACM3O3_10890 [Syntrophothermus sp.]
MDIKYNLPENVKISLTPKYIDTSDLELEQGKCFLNSYRISKKYSNVDIIEGLIIFISIRNTAKILPHVWNKENHSHFDVTIEKVLSKLEEMQETKYIDYFVIKNHHAKDFKNGDTFEFCEDTLFRVNELNEILKKKA